MFEIYKVKGRVHFIKNGQLCMEETSRNTFFDYNAAEEYCDTFKNILKRDYGLEDSIYKIECFVDRIM